MQNTKTHIILIMVAAIITPTQSMAAGVDFILFIPVIIIFPVTMLISIILTIVINVPINKKSIILASVVISPPIIAYFLVDNMSSFNSTTLLVLYLSLIAFLPAIIYLIARILLHKHMLNTVENKNNHINQSHNKKTKSEKASEVIFILSIGIALTFFSLLLFVITGSILNA